MVSIVKTINQCLDYLDGYDYDGLFPNFVDIHFCFNKIQEDYIILDYRDYNEWKNDHINGSINYQNMSTLNYRCPIIIIEYNAKTIEELMNLHKILKNKLEYKMDNIYFMTQSYYEFKSEYPFAVDMKYSYPSVIIPQKLYLGNYKQRHNPNIMKDLKITHIVDLSNMNGDNIQNKNNILNVKVNDACNVNIRCHFNPCIQFIDQALMDKNNRVFIHCEMGISRGPTITIAYIMKSHQYSLFKAYKKVHLCRHKTRPNGHFLDQLSSFEKALFNNNSTLQDVNDSGMRRTSQFF